MWRRDRSDAGPDRTGGGDVKGLGGRSRRAVKVVLLVGVLAFVGHAMAGHLAQLQLRTLRPNVGWLAVACVCQAGMYASHVVSYRWLLRAFAAPVPWRTMAAVAWVPLPAKYVPGKVAAIGSSLYLLRRAGVPTGVALSGAIMLDALPVLAGLVVGSGVLLDDAIRASIPGGRAAPWVIAVALMGGVVVIHPAVFGRLLDTALRVLKRPPLPRRPRLADYAVPAVCAVGQWLAGGLAMWAICRALFDVRASAVPLFVASRALADTLGYLTLFAPGGFGPREGLLLALLSPSIGPAAASVTAIGLRVVQVVIELTLFTVGLALTRPQPTAAPTGRPVRGSANDG